MRIARLQRALRTAIAVAGVAAAPALADMSARVGGVDVYLAGVLNTQVGFGLHRQGETNPAPGAEQQGDIPGLHEAYTWLDLETEWRFGEHWMVRLNPFVMSDLTYLVYDGNEDWRVFEPSRRNLEVDDALQRILREAYLQYTEAFFQVRAGRQTVGWGESDGL